MTVVPLSAQAAMASRMTSSAGARGKLEREASTTRRSARGPVVMPVSSPIRPAAEMSGGMGGVSWSAAPLPIVIVVGGAAADGLAAAHRPGPTRKLAGCLRGDSGGISPTAAIEWLEGLENKS